MAFGSPARISGGHSVVMALRQHVTDAVTLVEEAVLAEQQAFAERQQGRASLDPNWKDLAGEFESWEDEGGNYAYGVPDQARGAVQAGLLEYGGLATPPTPLMRMGVLSDVADIGWSLSDRFRQGGY